VACVVSHKLYEACLLVRLAACFKCVQVAPSPLSEATSTAVGMDPLTGSQMVYVLSSDKDSTQHNKKNPGRNFAAAGTLVSR
jgi:hypothetical protein